MNHVEAQPGRRAQVALDGLVHFRQLLFDGRVARRIHAGQAPQARDAFQQREWVERWFRRRGLPGVAQGRAGRRHDGSIAWALRPTRAIAGLQMR